MILEDFTLFRLNGLRQMASIPPQAALLIPGHRVGRHRDTGDALESPALCREYGRAFEAVHLRHLPSMSTQPNPLNETFSRISSASRPLLATTTLCPRFEQTPGHQLIDAVVLDEARVRWGVLP